ncbi:hypothetical protein I79_016211 [Cricetulus griseus]|uniref:Uncharacterized protein n=1 Tax=Cricetulus griseus TaxID=10029 RepID=G3HYS0_CRIGR|nr:hypothetical protein I79_016211 [Cricetulus griseus]
MARAVPQRNPALGEKKNPFNGHLRMLQPPGVTSSERQSEGAGPRQWKDAVLV